MDPNHDPATLARLGAEPHRILTPQEARWPNARRPDTMHSLTIRAPAPKAFALLLLYCSFGCDKSAGGVDLVDTEGRRFKMSCEQSPCELRRISGKPSSPAKTDIELQTSGRVVGICDVAPQADPEPGDCRALVCQADRDCPPLHGLEQGSCVNKLCIAPENELVSADAVLLCLAGTGLGRDAPKQVERYAMAMNCGRPCRVPAPCRQP